MGIKDPSDLVSTMGSYYNSLGKGPTEATFTVPYKDAFSKIGNLECLYMSSVKSRILEEVY